MSGEQFVPDTVYEGSNGDRTNPENPREEECEVVTLDYKKVFLIQEYEVMSRKSLFEWSQKHNLLSTVTLAPVSGNLVIHDESSGYLKSRKVRIRGRATGKLTNPMLNDKGESISRKKNVSFAVGIRSEFLSR